jgi:hypothetical protein
VGAALSAMDGGDTVFDGPQFGDELSLSETIPLQVVGA